MFKIFTAESIYYRIKLSKRSLDPSDYVTP